MIDTGIAIAGVLISLITVGASSAGSWAVMKWRQNSADERRKEDLKAAEKQRLEDLERHKDEIKRMEDSYRRELVRVEAMLKDEKERVSEEFRTYREAWAAHNMASEDIRAGLTRMETHYEHIVEDINEIKESIKEMAKAD